MLYLLKYGEVIIFMSTTLELYGHLMSQPSRSLIIYCKLSNIPYNFHNIEFLTARDNMTDEYAKIHPFQEIPAILHGKYNLWESAAIVTYLADAYNLDNQWYPKDIKQRGLVNAYLH